MCCSHSSFGTSSPNWSGTMYLASTEEPLDEVRARCARSGVAWFSQGRPGARAGATGWRSKLLGWRVARERIKAADTAEAKAVEEKKPDDSVARAMADALRGFAFRIQDHGIRDRGPTAGARVGRRRTWRSPDTVRLGQGSVGHSPRRASMLALGDTGKAEELARDAVQGGRCPSAAAGHARGAPLASGEERGSAGDLRESAGAGCAASISMSRPFARLAPLAEARKLPRDWRPADVSSPPMSATRPALASARSVSLASFAGADVDVCPIRMGSKSRSRTTRASRCSSFFISAAAAAGCMEQLNIFAPKMQAFADAGIQIVAVSTDSADGLHKTFEKAKDSAGFAFPILADESQSAFKAYRAFDDFEHIPLHGTFPYRWRRAGALAGYFLSSLSAAPTGCLAEAKRLLSVPKSAPAAGVADAR